MTILYKYFPLEKNDHFERITKLLEGLLYYASPVSFNDPFEMKPVYSHPTRNDVSVAVKEMVRTPNLLSRSERKKIHKQVTEHLSSHPPSVPGDAWLNKIGVLCLTQDPLNLLMWAHYASNHTGLCVGFDSSHAPFSFARPICYSEERPHVSLLESLRTEEELVTSVLFSKSSHWKYESEYRCIKRPVSESEKNYYLDLLTNNSSRMDEIAHLLASEGGPGLFQFDPNSIRRIYFGARISESNRGALAMHIHKRGLRSKLIQLSLDKNKYKLNENLHKYSKSTQSAQITISR